MVTSEVRRGGATCGDAEAIAGEGHLSGVGSHFYFPSRRGYLLPMPTSNYNSDVTKIVHSIKSQLYQEQFFVFLARTDNP